MNIEDNVLIPGHDWNGKPISMVRSRGSGVWAVTKVFDNLVSTGCQPWPHADVTQKLIKSSRLGDFGKAQQRLLTDELGYYSDLQSLNSEDAITWSVFGTMKNAPTQVQEQWVAEIFTLIGLNASPLKPQIYLWKRLPHPETGRITNGSEIDACIITEDAHILIECKWNAKEYMRQGINKDKGQIQLRGEYLMKYNDKKSFLAVIGLGLNADSFFSKVPTGVFYNEIHWDEICSMKSHPLVNELMEYYKWKVRHTISPNGKQSIFNTRSNHELV